MGNKDPFEKQVNPQHSAIFEQDRVPSAKNVEETEVVQSPEDIAFGPKKPFLHMRSLADDIRHMWHIEAGDLNHEEAIESGQNAARAADAAFVQLPSRSYTTLTLAAKAIHHHCVSTQLWTLAKVKYSTPRNKQYAPVAAPADRCKAWRALRRHLHRKSQKSLRKLVVKAASKAQYARAAAEAARKSAVASGGKKAHRAQQVPDTDLVQVQVGASLMSKIFSLEYFSYDMTIDNGNLEAGVSIRYRALGSGPKKLGFRVKLNLKALAQKIFDTVLNFFRNLWDNVKKEATKAWNAVKQKGTDAINKIKQVINDIKACISNPLRCLGNAIVAVGKAIGKAAKAVGRSFVKAGQAIGAGLNRAGRAISSAVSKGWNTVKDLGNKALTATWNAMSSAAKKVWGGVKKFFSGWRL